MFSPTELLLVLACVLIFVGGKKLPEIGQGLGKGISEFKKAIGAEGEKEKPAEGPKTQATEEKKPESK